MEEKTLLVDDGRCSGKITWRKMEFYKSKKVIKKAGHRRIDAFELWCWRTLESPLDCKQSKPVNPNGNQSWIFTVRTEAPKLWPPDVKRQLTGKDLDAGKDWGQEEKGMTEDEMAGWHHRLNALTWVWANSERQWRTGMPGMLHSPWGYKESDPT